MSGHVFSGNFSTGPHCVYCGGWRSDPALPEICNGSRDKIKGETIERDEQAVAWALMRNGGRKAIELRDIAPHADTIDYMKEHNVAQWTALYPESVVVALRGLVKEYLQRAITAEDTVAKLKATMESERRDAERYRKLRDKFEWYHCYITNTMQLKLDAGKSLDEHADDT